MTRLSRSPRAMSAAGTRSTLVRFLSDEHGATAIEYSMIGALISIVIIGSVRPIGTTLSGFFNKVSNGFTSP